MDVIFGTPELVSLVMDQIYGEFGPSALVACATVNQVFCNESLRVLWRSMTDLSPMIRLLPRQAVVYKHGRWILTRPLTPPDWDRVHLYSGLVRELQLTSGRPPHVNSIPERDIFESYITCFPYQYLFPNLIRLSWNASTDVLPILSPVLAQTLRKIVLVVPGPAATSHSAHQLFTATLPKLPDLRELTVTESALGARVSPQELKNILADSITSLTLENFRLSINHVFALRQLSNLERLNIHVGSDIEEQDSSGWNNVSHPFERLAHLEIRGSVYNVAYVIQHAQMQPHHHLSIFGPQWGKLVTEEVAELLRVVGSFERRTLQHFSFEMVPVISDRSMNMVLPAETLLPLLVHDQLKTLTINPNVPIRLQDDDIWSIARALPHLQVLELSHSPDNTPEGYESPLTPACLMAFALHTTSLRELSIHLGQRWKPFLDDRIQLQSDCRLTVLALGDSRFPEDTSAIDVATALEELFPDISELTCTDMYLLDAQQIDPDHALRERLALASAWYDVKRRCCGYLAGSEAGMEDD
ncbi:hypothetical protein FRC03_008755 [Tulasnella sp. 419]|nr:hypothetical protein FRC03_008755 [Tulasnella sp. 419]